MNPCPNCSQALEADAQFCPNCGTPVVSVRSAPEAGQPFAPQPAMLLPASAGGPSSQRNSGQSAKQSSGKSLKVIAGAAAAVVLVGAGGFVAVHALSSNATGASTPAEAVTGVAKAVSVRDPLKALTLIAPAQVRGFADVYDLAKNKAGGAGLINKQNPFAGLNVSVSGVSTKVVSLGKNAAAVTVTSGDLRYQVQNKDLSPALKDHDSSGHVDLAALSDDAIGENAPIIAIKQDGKWYVSPADTALEWFRRANSLPAGNFGDDAGSSSTGSDSPQAVLTDVAKAVPGIQVGQLLDLVSPDELGAVYHYRKAIVEYLNNEGVLSDLQDQGQLTVEDVVSDVKDKTDNSARVVLRSVSGQVSSQDSSGRYTYEDGCLRFVSSDGSGNDNECLNKVLSSYGVARKTADSTDLSVDVVKVGDRWYFSPVRTLSRLAKTVLGGLGSKDVLSALSAEQAAPSEGELTAAETKGTFDSDRDFHVYSLPVTPGSLFRVCTSDGYTSAFTPNGDRRSDLSEGVYRADAAGPYKIVVEAGGDSGDFTVTAAGLVSKPVALGARISGDVASTGCTADVHAVNLADHQSLKLEGAGETELIGPNGETQSGPVFTATTAGTYLILHDMSGPYSQKLTAITND